MTQISILGTGTSTGIPLLGCSCNVCLSDDPKDKRFRSSLYITANNGTSFLIDTSPDLRSQLLSNCIKSIDNVFITHEHADHLHGIDDLRPLSYFNGRKPIPLFSSTQTAPHLKKRFCYIFDQEQVKKKQLGGGIPLITLTELSIVNDELFHYAIGDTDFVFFLLPHGETWSTGFYLKECKFVYIPDCHLIPDSVLTYLKKEKPQLLIIDCLRPKRHNTHLNVEQSFQMIQEISPSQAGLIHMGHQLSHSALTQEAKAAFSFPVAPLFDGEQFQLN